LVPGASEFHVRGAVEAVAEAAVTAAGAAVLDRLLAVVALKRLQWGDLQAHLSVRYQASTSKA
jgi:hypothetical protein